MTQRIPTTTIPSLLVLLFLTLTPSTISFHLPTNTIHLLQYTSPTPPQRTQRRQRLPVSPIHLSDSKTDTGASDTTEEGEDLDLGFDWKVACSEVFEGCERPVVLFDGVCKFCNGSVNYVLDNDSKGNFRFASLQSSIGKSLLLRAGKTPTDHSSIVVVTPTSAYDKSDAVLYIASRLDGNAYAPFVGKWSRFLPRFFRNVVYDFVSKNRYRWGESDSCRVDLMEFEDRFVKDPVRDGEEMEDNTSKKKECKDV